MILGLARMYYMLYTGSRYRSEGNYKDRLHIDMYEDKTALAFPWRVVCYTYIHTNGAGCVLQ